MVPKHHIRYRESQRPCDPIDTHHPGTQELAPLLPASLLANLRWGGGLLDHRMDVMRTGGEGIC